MSYANPLLTTENLTVGYDEPVVREANIAFPSGELTAILGPNGCGKSTLLKCLARVLPPMSGRVVLGEDSVHKAPSKQIAKQLALLPQGVITPEGLTVKELVAQGRYPHQSILRQWSRDDEQAVIEAMEKTETLSLADRPVLELSGGQRQRCWIAMVLAQQTPFILLDEPTTYLDLRIQVELMTLLRELTHEGGRTVIVVLHELNLAAAYADHLVMMRDGRVYTEGAPETTFTSENLQAVFDLKANILTDPATGQRICVPLSNKRPSACASENSLPKAVL